MENHKIGKKAGRRTDKEILILFVKTVFFFDKAICRR